MLQPDVIRSMTGIDPDAMAIFVISKVVAAASANTKNIIGI